MRPITSSFWTRGGTLSAAWRLITAPYDALVMPTTPITAPRIADLASDDAYRHANAAMLRNPAVANFLDRCSISVPCHALGDAPVGLMLIGEHGADRKLLAMAAAIEQAGAARRAIPLVRASSRYFPARKSPLRRSEAGFPALPETGAGAPRASAACGGLSGRRPPWRPTPSPPRC